MMLCIKLCGLLWLLLLLSLVSLLCSFFCRLCCPYSDDDENDDDDDDDRSGVIDNSLYPHANWKATSKRSTIIAPAHWLEKAPRKHLWALTPSASWVCTDPEHKQERGWCSGSRWRSAWTESGLLSRYNACRLWRCPEINTHSRRFLNSSRCLLLPDRGKSYCKLLMADGLSHRPPFLSQFTIANFRVVLRLGDGAGRWRRW